MIRQSFLFSPCAGDAFSDEDLEQHAELGTGGVRKQMENEATSMRVSLHFSSLDEL